MVWRGIKAVLLIIVALLAGLMAADDGTTIDHTITNSRQLDRQFKVAAREISAFRKLHRRWPAFSELEETLNETDDGGRYTIEVTTTKFDQCAAGSPGTFGAPTANDYVLASWRGKWWECYQPSKGLTTLTFKPSDYTILGERRRDRLLFFGIAILCLLLSMRLLATRR